MNNTLNDMAYDVRNWMLNTFGDDDKTIWVIRERTLRFIEEALELVQALGLTSDEVKRVSDYVYARTKGEPSQEVSGVLITLLGLCTAAKIDPDLAFNNELVRIQDPAVMQRVRERQAEKRALTDRGADDAPTPVLHNHTIPCPHCHTAQRVLDDEGEMRCHCGCEFAYEITYYYDLK